MNPPNAQPAHPINGSESGQDTSGSRTAPLEGEYVKRRRRRRLDLRTLHGTLRESARTYREYAEGRISAGEIEVRSRALKRHGELLSAFEQGEQIRQLQAQLAAIQGQTVTPLTIDPSPVPDLQQQLAENDLVRQ